MANDPARTKGVELYRLGIPIVDRSGPHEKGGVDKCSAIRSARITQTRVKGTHSPLSDRTTRGWGKIDKEGSYIPLQSASRRGMKPPRGVKGIYETPRN